ncbi:hypothetical protein PIB30_085646 [Stylosanthes scabra]|uniref:Transposase (putative) gypsy type domain-containing protein n=1 Tax=Stylosanthes scabra TaxID=79078 RepID=A0ABU6WW85_9FABA|nr:hypothetical protein [Stylosanthes scabra]
MEENRETNENGKLVVRVPVDDPYSWVKGEVRDIVSLFRDLESIAELGDPFVWVREGEVVKLEFLPCSLEDRVFHKAEGWDYFFMHTIVFIDLGVRFPFSRFECGVLSQLKCAPSQIHPNAWAFIRGFEDFKQMYVRVGSSEDGFPFYVDENLLERFLLYWYSELVQILGMNTVNEESGLVVDFLDQYFKTEQGVVVNQPSEKKKMISVKRRRAKGKASGRGKVIDLTSSKCCGKEVSLEEVKVFIENQKKLHGYIGAEDLSLVWSEDFPLPVCGRILSVKSRF